MTVSEYPRPLAAVKTAEYGPQSIECMDRETEEARRRLDRRTRPATIPTSPDYGV